MPDFIPHCFYSRAVDVWAIGCLVTEMLMGEPLFPGDSDIDQLYHIMMCLGKIIPLHFKFSRLFPYVFAHTGFTSCWYIQDDTCFRWQEGANG